MQVIDVHELPEPMARAVAETVEHLKSPIRRRAAAHPPVQPLTWPLGARGRLSREESYDHLDTECVHAAAAASR